MPTTITGEIARMEARATQNSPVVRVAAALLGLIAVFALQARAQSVSPQGSWATTGSLATYRSGHTATLLANGKVLVVGGSGGFEDELRASAELYDPADGQWRPTAPLARSRTSHTATLLPDGRVLVAGGFVGFTSVAQATRTVELYDPISGTWTDTGSMIGARGAHRAELLQDGTVLVAGGRFGGVSLDTAEIFDPVLGTWRTTGRLHVARTEHSMTRLQDGKVLVAGGMFGDNSSSTDSAELYEPTAGTWTTTSRLPHASGSHTSSLLADGRVLVAGGNIVTNPGAFSPASLDQASLFHPATGTWSFTGNLNGARSYHTATVLATGEVLVAGGARWVGPFSADNALGTELYDAGGATWRPAGQLVVPREGHTSTRLPDGRVLVAGGQTLHPNYSTSVLDSAELYTPAPSIDADYSGGWFDPAQNGHGIFIQVLPENRILAWWFAFDPAGTQQAWFGGVGTYSGNTATIDAVLQTTGGRWIPNFNPATVVHNAWGRFTFTFSDRDHGRVDFESVRGYGSGSMQLTRLTQAAPASAVETSIGSPGAVTTDNSGNVFFSSSPNGVFKLDSEGNLARIAGSGAPGYSGDGGTALLAQLNFPLSYPEFVNDPIDFSELTGPLAVDAAGNLYIGDAYNNRVRKIDTAGIITTFAGDGVRGNSGDGGQATSARFWWPQGVGVDASGNVLISDSNGTLRTVAPSGIVSRITGNNCGPAFMGPGLCAPQQLTVDPAGNVFVPDAYCRVRKITPAGIVTTIAGNDRRPSGGLAFTCGYSGDGGPARDAALGHQPYSVAVDSSGNIFIADTDNNSIRKVDAAGIITRVVGVVAPRSFGGDGGPAGSARLNAPHGVAVDGEGRLYIADTGNNRIRRVSADGIITTIAGNGSGTVGPGYSGGWFDPEQDGHGIFIQVLPGGRALAWWFGFNPEGTQQAWFGGVGTYTGNTLTISSVIQTTGGRFVPNFDSTQVTNRNWGSFKFTFTDCNHGWVDFSSGLGYGSGYMNLTRLSLPAGQICH